MRRSWAFLCAALISSIANAEHLQVRVAAITDGDTITVITDEKQRQRVRIGGIDAPEKGQPFADRSRQSLARMAAGKDATLQCHKTDRYARKVCKVMVQPSDCPSCSHTLDVGLAQISVGLAWWYREYAREQSPDDRGRYESEEVEARLRKRGLWAMPDPTPPWEWRKAKNAAEIGGR